MAEKKNDVKLGLNVTGVVNCFVNKFKNGDGTFSKRLMASVSTKGKDGNYQNSMMELSICDKSIPKEKINALKENVCYTIAVEGFLSFNRKKYDEKSVTFWKIVAQKAKVVGTKEFEVKQSDDDLPF